MREQTPTAHDVDSFEQSLESIERLAAEISDLTEVSNDPDTDEDREIADALAALERARPPQPSPHRPRIQQSCGTTQPPVDHTSDETTRELPQLPTARSLPPSRPCPSAPLPSGARTPKMLRLFYPDKPAHSTVYRTSTPLAETALEAELDADDEPVFLQPLTETTQEVRELRSERRHRAVLIVGVLLCVLALPALALTVWKPWEQAPASSPQEWSEEDANSQYDAYNGPVSSDDPTEETQSSEGPDPSSTSPGNDTNSSPQDETRPDRPPENTSPADTETRRGASDPLYVKLNASDISPRVGDKVYLSVHWTDGVGQLAGVQHSWGDGSPGAGNTSTPSCSNDQYEASGERHLEHTFTQAGRFTAHVKVTTYTCDGRQETQEVTMVFNVSEAEPSPSASQQSPEPTATPGRQQ